MRYARHIRLVSPLFALGTLAACETTPDPANTDAPTLSVKSIEGGKIRTILSTVPGETVERTECANGSYDVADQHVLPRYPAKLMAIYVDDDGVEYARVITPNGEQTNVSPTDAVVTNGTGGRGSTIYDYVTVDWSGETPRTPLPISFEFEPDPAVPHRLYFFGPSRDTLGNGASAQLGPALQIGLAEEICSGQ